MNHEKTISDLAYHLWRARGCPNGSAEVDWAEAERQVRGTRSGSARHTLEAFLPKANTEAAIIHSKSVDGKAIKEQGASEPADDASVPDAAPMSPTAAADTPAIRAKKKAKR